MQASSHGRLGRCPHIANFCDLFLRGQLFLDDALVCSESTQHTPAIDRKRKHRQADTLYKIRQRLLARDPALSMTQLRQPQMSDVIKRCLGLDEAGYKSFYRLVERVMHQVGFDGRSFRTTSERGFVEEDALNAVTKDQAAQTPFPNTLEAMKAADGRTAFKHLVQKIGVNTRRREKAASRKHRSTALMSTPERTPTDLSSLLAANFDEVVSVIGHDSEEITLCVLRQIVYPDKGLDGTRGLQQGSATLWNNLVQLLGNNLCYNPDVDAIGWTHKGGTGTSVIKTGAAFEASLWVKLGSRQPLKLQYLQGHLMKEKSTRKATVCRKRQHEQRPTGITLTRTRRGMNRPT